jgi:hypothetical protein
MKNKDVKKYIKYLTHQIEYIEKDLEATSKHIELSTRSLKAVKGIINQLSQDIFLDEIEGKTISYNNLKDNNVDVVYTTRNGTKKEFNVPVHPYGQVEEKELFEKLEAIAKADVPSAKPSWQWEPTLEQKAAAFQQCCGRYKKD